MKKIYAALLSVIYVLNTNAQLTQANHAPSAGDSYQMYQCDSTNISPGPSGAGAVWNYSAVVTHSSMLNAYTGVANSNTAYPTASVAVVSSSANSSYYSSSPTVLNYFGGNLSAGVAKATINYTSPAVYATYPMNLNSTGSATIGGAMTVTITGFGTFAGTFSGASNVLADGSGTLVLPGTNATFTNVLRVMTTQTIYFSSTASGTVFSVNYDYYTPGIKASLFNIFTSTLSTAFGPSSQTVVTRNKDAVITATTTVGLGDKSIDAMGVQVFPNPSNTDINFIMNSAQSAKLLVYDVTGKLIEKINFNEGVIKLNVRDMNKGLYLYQAVSNDNRLLKSGRFTVLQ